jgi:hypothetical protein
MTNSSVFGAVVLATVFMPAFPATIMVSATRPTAGSITAASDQFRVDIGGGVVAGANGSFGEVRREINWDDTNGSLGSKDNKSEIRGLDNPWIETVQREM